ncbi:hypothetical protein [uncultured Alistipes sp.]|uniref:hypothetical protein n=1 Tax=uncultured Alistipes sp. TaxID=538949 RepID=UPI0028041F1C|nr:hypothetical protein [uncultured Alistipes sp.]
MNNIKKCSISGVAFSLDEEAYKTLEAYLESLRESYGETAARLSPTSRPASPN